MSATLPIALPRRTVLSALSATTLLAACQRHSGHGLLAKNAGIGSAEDTTQEFGAIADEAIVIQSRLQQGLSYFGLPRNYVTRLALDAYDDYIKEIVQLGSVLDATRSKYATEDTLIQNKIQAMDEAVSHAQTSRVQLSQAQSQYEDETNQLQSLINSLLTEITSARAAVEAQRQSFNSAVQAATNGCGLLQVVEIVSCIVAIGTGAYAGCAAVASAIGGLSSAGSVLATLPTIEKAVEVVSKDYSDISQKYQKLKSITSNADARRLIMREEDVNSLTADFDRKVDQAPVAQDIRDGFKAAVHHMLDLIKTRNQKIMEFDGLQTKIAEVKAQIRSRQAQIVSLQNQKASTANPDLNSYLSTLDTITDASRERIRTLIWQEIRAYDLWTLRSPETASQFQLVGKTIGDLAGTQAIVRSAVASDDADLPGAAQKLDPYLEFRVKLSAVQRAALQARKLTFTLRLSDLPDPWFAIYASAIAVLIPGSGAIGGTLVHSGRSDFRDRTLTPLSYSMAPTMRGFKANTGSFIDLGAVSGKYVGLSPFSDWTVVLSEVEKPQALANTAELIVRFQGTFRATIAVLNKLRAEKGQQ